MGDASEVSSASIDIFATAKNTLTDILATRFTPKDKNTVLRIGVILSAAGKFGITISDGTTTTGPHYFEEGGTLTAGNPYTWVWPVGKNYTYNFQHSGASGTLVTLKAEEISSAEI